MCSEGQNHKKPVDIWERKHRRKGRWEQRGKTVSEWEGTLWLEQRKEANSCECWSQSLFALESSLSCWLPCLLDSKCKLCVMQVSLLTLYDPRFSDCLTISGCSSQLVHFWVSIRHWGGDGRRELWRLPNSSWLIQEAFSAGVQQDPLGSRKTGSVAMAMTGLAILAHVWRGKGKTGSTFFPKIRPKGSPELCFPIQ